MSVYFSLTYQKKKGDYRKDEELTISIYYYFQKKKLKITSGIKVKLKDWNEDWSKSRDKNPILKTDKNHTTKNILLKQKVKEIEDIVDRIKLNNQVPLVELVKSHFNQRIEKKEKKTRLNLDFLFVLTEYRKYIENDMVLREGYKKSIKTSLNRIEEFTKEFYKNSNYRLLISDVDDDFQRNYLKYSSQKNEQPSTIRKRLKTLISLINWCRKNGYTEHSLKLIPFNYNFDKEVIYLLRDEVLKLFEFNKFNFTNEKHKEYTSEYITDYLKNDKLITYTNYEVYKDMIVLGSGIGCRYGDLVNLKLDNYQFSNDRTKGFFVFRMEKSRSSKRVKVPINKLTYEIWKKYSKNKKRTDYIFPRTKKGNPISNQKVNKHIKDIGKIVGLNRLVSNPKFSIDGKIIEGSDTRTPLYNLLTTHIIRRTFIREGIENKIPTHVLMSMSGHTTEKVYQKYFSTTNKEIDEEGRKMFSYDLENETKSKEEVKSIPKTEKSVEEELIRLKSLFNKGLIPKEVYIQKISDLV